MADAQLAPSPLREADQSLENEKLKKPNPISVSNGTKLASPFPSPTATNRPASLRQPPPTGAAETEKASETKEPSKPSGATASKKENLRASSTQRGSPKDHPSPGHSTAEQ
ncbi:uncharacterized protein N7473_009032 [Penicillium subrubescens]|uniref:uncharacterized protein n=1 Tax=Penicillium subrubescens TaxID=1316194 RepID=UPI0025459F81|nr:uncharacterized protein N7473_009032 [Penicillium subrubescens]KAJ5886358.1 hypothetical protein N7473_009032 [Penicillium subrubescens]